MMEKMDKYDTILWRLRELEENSKCADCTDSFPRYMNTTYGTFVCSVCGAIHRELGNRVKSLSSDKFTQQDIERLEKVGNKMADEIWLSKWSQKQYPIPFPSDEKKVRDFIKMKYIEKKWIKEGIKQSDFISPPTNSTPGSTPTFTSPKQQSTSTPQKQITSPSRNSGETKEKLTSKDSLSKEFESLSLGNSNNLLNINNNQLPSTQSTQQSIPFIQQAEINQQSNLNKFQQQQQPQQQQLPQQPPQQQYDSNGKPFNPFRDENKYFNSKPQPAEKKSSFPPFSERPYDQHSYLNEKSSIGGEQSLGNNSSFYSKIQIQHPTPKPPPTSIYDTQQYKQQHQQQYQPQQYQNQQSQYNGLNSQINGQSNQITNQINGQIGNSIMDSSQMGNNNFQHQPQQYNPFIDTSISNNQLALVPVDQGNNNNQMVMYPQQPPQQPQQYPQTQQNLSNINIQQHQQYQPHQQQNLSNINMNNSNGNIPNGNPFGISDQVVLQHQQMHQQNMQQQQINQQPQMMMNSNGQMVMVAGGPATTTTTTIIHTPINGNVPSSSSGNPFDQQQQPLDEMFGKKVNSDPVFPASGSSFESGNSLDRSDEEQKEAWRRIQEKNIQIQNDKEIARKLQLEEEEIFKTRPRSNTEPSRRTTAPPPPQPQSQQYHYSSYSSSYDTANNHGNGMPITQQHIISGHHRSSSGSNILRRLSGRSRSKSYDYDDPFEISPRTLNKSGGYDDYDSFMRKNKRIPGGGSNYQPKFSQQDYYQDNNNNNNNYQEHQPSSQQIVVHEGYNINNNNNNNNNNNTNNTKKSYNECEYCGKDVGLESMSYHKNTECILRQERCSMCNKLVKHMQMGDHQLQCQTNTYTCGVCGRLVMGKEMPNHMAYVHNQ
ncbi:hypothetical protein ACTFIV_002579 [Dictyostelium citrinum]